MSKIKYTQHQADVLNKIADFMDTTVVKNVDMTESSLTKHGKLCSPGCFGSWLSVFYTPEKKIHRFNDGFCYFLNDFFNTKKYNMQVFPTHDGVYPDMIQGIYKFSKLMQPVWLKGNAYHIWLHDSAFNENKRTFSKENPVTAQDIAHKLRKVALRIEANIKRRTEKKRKTHERKYLEAIQYEKQGIKIKISRHTRSYFLENYGKKI